MIILLQHNYETVGVLADWQIRSRCEGDSPMVEPFVLDLLNPASLDVVLGPYIMVEDPSNFDLVRVDISEHTEENPWQLDPGEFVLGETRETFNLPNTISAQFVLKSSRARAGYDHALAGWADPGWAGSKLTVELKNNRRYHPLPLYPGLKIGQMVFHWMDETPVLSYPDQRGGAHYMNHQTVMPDIAVSRSA